MRELIERLKTAADGMLPDALAPVSDEWCQLCERAAYVDKIKISGELAEAIVAAVCAPAAVAREAAAALEAAREDVERYRWLRDPNNYPNHKWWGDDLGMTDDGQSFDADIDQARGKADGEAG